ncbi:hypothetical protein [Almyronema epifaneia]|uniref:Uncharacterized protein n=1 Tax=Almyronema epifaneia S1 TaxID=2991925 RepID=A0ABW6IE86_9CYAN
MKASIWLAPAIALLLSQTAMAQTEPTVPPSAVEPTALASVLTEYEAILVKVLQTAEYDLSAADGAAIPITLYLAQPILYQGNVAIAADCPIAARLVPSESGVQIVTEAILVDGQLIPLQATSAIVPPSRIEVVPPPEAQPRSAPLPPSLYTLGNSLGGSNENGLVIMGQFAEFLFDVFSADEDSDRVIISLAPGSQYVLQLTPTAL